MDREKLEKAIDISAAIEYQKDCLSDIVRCQNLNKHLCLTDFKTKEVVIHFIPEKIQPLILDLLTDYHNNILSELEKEFEEL